MTHDKEDEKNPLDQSDSKPRRDANGRFLGGGGSANPKGRPAKVKESLAETLFRIAHEPVTINEKGRRRAISADEAVLRVLRNRALNGDPAAQAQWLKCRPIIEKYESECRAREIENTGYRIKLRNKIEDMAAKWQAEQAAKKKRDDGGDEIA
jgi:hypothetical protein